MNNIWDFSCQMLKIIKLSIYKYMIMLKREIKNNDYIDNYYIYLAFK